MDLFRWTIPKALRSTRHKASVKYMLAEEMNYKGLEGQADSLRKGETKERPEGSA